jgi:hypothetical protein
MAYNKTNWVNGQTPINATNLNKIENQLEANDTATTTNATNIENLGAYSTTEIVVGTWTDGKPLYRKIYTVGALKNNGSTVLNFSSEIRVKTFDVFCSNGNYTFKLPVVGTNYIATFYRVDTNINLIEIQTTSDRTSYTDNYAIVYYTKTTD